MEPDRFEDVAFRMIEEPDQRPPRHRRRWVAALAGSVLAAGALAAGASALTGGDEAAPPAKHRIEHRRGDWMGSSHHHGCRRHQQRPAADATKL
jgi:hypothetical protein